MVKSFAQVEHQQNRDGYYFTITIKRNSFNRKECFATIGEVSIMTHFSAKW
jgi:hypothetical protein